MREVKCIRCGKRIESGKVIYMTFRLGDTTGTTFPLLICWDYLIEIMKDDCLNG